MKKRHVKDEENDPRILKSLQDKSGVIDEETANLIVERMRKALGPTVFSMAENFGVNAQELVRSQPLFHTCKATREKKGLTVKQAAAILNVPQYRIKALEGCSGPFINKGRRP